MKVVVKQANKCRQSNKFLALVKENRFAGEESPEPAFRQASPGFIMTSVVVIDSGVHLPGFLYSAPSFTMYT